MKKRLIGTIACFVMTLALLGVWHLNISDKTAAVLLYLTSLSAVCFLCFGVTAIFGWKKSAISPYWIFGVTDVLIGGVAAIFAVINLATAKGDFDGILGAMIIVVGAPVMLVILIGNYIVSRIMEDK